MKIDPKNLWLWLPIHILPVSEVRELLAIGARPARANYVYVYEPQRFSCVLQGGLFSLYCTAPLCFLQSIQLKMQLLAGVILLLSH